MPSQIKKGPDPEKEEKEKNEKKRKLFVASDEEDDEFVDYTQLSQYFGK